MESDISTECTTKCSNAQRVRHAFVMAERIVIVVTGSCDG